MEYLNCPICKLEKCEIKRFPKAHNCVCKRCGRFAITNIHGGSMMDSSNSELHSFIGNSPDFQLSAWVRKRNEKNEVPEISSKNIDIIKEQLPKYTPGEKQTILLQALARKIQYPGHKVCVRILSDVTLCWASSEIEFGFVVIFLKCHICVK